MIPFGITQTLVIGELDTIVPRSQAISFADAARRVGDPVEVVEIAGAGHFELVDPAGPAFATVRSWVVNALEPAWGE